MSYDPKKTIRQCVDVLERITNDDSVPRNIRRDADEVRNILLNENEPPAVRAASAISILDEMTNDPNIPMHTRTLIWNISSQLETVPVE